MLILKDKYQFMTVRYDGFVIPYKISEFTPYKNIPYASTYVIKGQNDI